MRKPVESLNEFNVIPAPKAAEPPSPVSLSVTGEFELLQPLVLPVDRATFKVVTAYTYVRPATNRQSWFHRSLALGGSFALISLILLSAVLVGIYEPTDDMSISSIDNAGQPIDLALDQLDDTLPPTEELIASDIFSATSPLEDDLPRTVRRAARIRRPVPRVRLAAYRRPHRFRRPLLAVSKFVPTTLIIYAENGEIKTRIEPQLIAAYTKDH